MSWWDIGGEGDDVIGDTPADLIKQALKAITQVRENQGQPKPSFQEMLDAFTTALREVYITSPGVSKQNSFREIVINLKSASTVKSSGRTPSVDHQIVTIFCRAFKEIEKAYEWRWERKPRLRELLEILSFILSSQPEGFLSAAEGIEIEEIIAR